MAENFFATLECELIQRRALHTQAEARMAVFQFIEGWYNTRRRHSALDYLSPNDFEHAAAAAVSQPNSDGGPERETGREIFLLGESGARDHPERLHDLSTMEKALLPAAVAHFTVAGHSPQLSTETG